MSSPPLRIGLVGCGRISDIYLQTLQNFSEVSVVGCASLDLNESKTKAQQYDLKLACTPDELIANEEIDCVLNLTVPAAHFDISRQALNAGKHVYAEKPFVTRREQGQVLLNLAAEKNLYLGNAPDTFLGRYN